MKNFENIKNDFPIFKREVNGKVLTYLDSGATSHKPKIVLDKMNEIYTVSNANVHRGTYSLSAETTQAYEDVRNKCKDFINAYSSDEIIFCKGTTEGFNFLANSITKKFMEPGDEIIVTEQGSDYINRKVVVDSQNYPPSDKKNLFNTFSGKKSFKHF